MYSLNVKKKYKMFYVKFTNKDKPDTKYLGMLFTAKTLTAVKVKIRDYVPDNFIVKRLVEIPYETYVRLARVYNLKELKKKQSHEQKVSTETEKLLKRLAIINAMIPKREWLEDE